MTKQGLCFDLDGTLIDSGREGLKRIIKIAQERNLSMSAEIEQRVRNMWGADPIRLLRTIWPEEDPNAFFANWEKMDMAEPLPTFPGTREAVEQLHDHFQLTILTNRYFKTIMSQLNHNGLANFFDLIVTPETSGHKKPEPGSIDPILAHYRDFGIDRHNIILIGDTVEGDWKLAQVIGIEFYAVTSGGVDTREKFLAAGTPEDHILNSVADLPNILLNIPIEK